MPQIYQYKVEPAVSSHGDNMRNGVLTHAKNFLVGNWKAQNQIAMESIPMQGLAFNGEVLTKEDKVAQLRMFKGIVYACSDLRGIGVAKTQLKVYNIKSSRAKSNYKRTFVRELTNNRQDEIIAKATPGTRLSMAESVEQVMNGPYVDLLRNVNDFTNSYDLKKLTSLYLDLTGDCYWALIRNRLGIPVNIWVLPSEYTKPIPDRNIFIKGYKYKRGTTEIIYPREDVVHFRYATPLNQFVGMAPLVAVLDAYNLRQYMINFEQQMFRTGGNHKVILTTKGSPTKPEAERIKERYKNTEEAGIAVFGGDSFEFFEPQSINARDMGYREGLSWSRDDISAAYHVPKSMLTADDVNLATATAQKHYLAEHATEPQVIQIDEKMNEQLSPQFNENQFALFDDPVPANREEAREDRKVNLELGVTTRAEERSQMGLDLIEGTDELLIPAGMIPLSQAGQEMNIDEAAVRVNTLRDTIMKRAHELRGEQQG